MNENNITAVIWKEGNAYVSKCIEYEIASAGNSQQEAFENLKDAFKLYVENAKALGILNDFAIRANFSLDHHDKLQNVF